MKKTNHKKLLNSKWTAIAPQNKEKHFLLIKVEKDEDENIIECIIEAIMTKNTYPIYWRDLNDAQQWLSGWK